MTIFDTVPNLPAADKCSFAYLDDENDWVTVNRSVAFALCVPWPKNLTLLLAVFSARSSGTRPCASATAPWCICNLGGRPLAVAAPAGKCASIQLLSPWSLMPMFLAALHSTMTMVEVATKRAVQILVSIVCQSSLAVAGKQLRRANVA